RATIIEGGGLGHVSDDLIQPITEGIKKGVFFGMTSQCIWGSVNLNVYETGRDLVSAGVVPLGDMLSEVALAKSMWVLGNGLNATGQMPLDLRGEVSGRRWLSVEQD
ncbi:MAG: Glu-tRNA(Gln) amidotransferase GatDE subunit D, partial [Nitrososphaerota archaeon]|nr:Glu-tRNA(Gln) amidotransferase GatDE subunit D [Nitrososphaerota archaeon]